MILEVCGEEIGLITEAIFFVGATKGSDDGTKHRAACILLVCDSLNKHKGLWNAWSESFFPLKGFYLSDGLVGEIEEEIRLADILVCSFG